MNFFGLENEKIEDKIIDRKERIYADAMIFTNGVTESIETLSFAPLLKIKFFLDIIEIIKDSKSRFVKIGRYFEMENNQTSRININDLFFDVIFTIRKEENKFTFNLFSPDFEFKLFVSNVTFTDSFCNEKKAWLNPTNIDNLLGKVEDDQFPYVLQTEFDDFKEKTEEHLEKHDKDIEEEIQNRKNEDSRTNFRLEFLNEELSEEKLKRENGDLENRNKIEEESKIRDNAVIDLQKQIKRNNSSLENKIKKEEELRIENDNKINQRIDNLPKCEVTKSDLQKEIADRKKGDSDLNNRINNLPKPEVTKSDLQQEIADRKKGDEDLTEKIIEVQKFDDKRIYTSVYKENLTGFTEYSSPFQNITKRLVFIDAIYKDYTKKVLTKVTFCTTKSEYDDAKDGVFAFYDFTNDSSTSVRLKNSTKNNIDIYLSISTFR